MKNKKQSPKKRGGKRQKNKDRKNSPNKREGVIYIASNNVGYVDVEGIEQDIQIQPQFLNTAFHGDVVEIALLPKSKKDTRTQGEVIRVKERSRKEFVGTIDMKNPKKSFAFLIPDDSRMHVDIFIPDAKKSGAKDGQKALVEIVDWGDAKKNPEGSIVKTLGEKGDNDVEMQSILLESGYRPDFPESVLKEAEKIQKQAHNIPREERNSRKDMTNIPTLTIDPSDAKDLDDALSIRKIDGNTFEVGIHIADVSHYVKEGSRLDLHAREKGTSVYLVDRTAPMFPENLSNDICSLNPGEEKLSFSVILNISKNGEVKSRWFGKTIINPDQRFSYEEAQKVLDKGTGKYAAELKNLNALAEKFQQQREKRGALTFEQEEIEFELDETGKPVNIIKKKILAAHKLIEEFMILANKEVATYFHTQEEGSNGFGIYRIHQPPKKKGLHELLDFLNVMGYDLKKPKKTITARELNNIFKAVKGKNEEYLVAAIAMQNMEKAIYSLENKGHYGLALKNYTHFTSPIRRYADLMVHRTLQAYLNDNPLGRDLRQKYKGILNGLTSKEVNAMQAERDSIKYKQIEYMLERKGEIFEGIIVNVFNWGMFVQEKSTKAEGLVTTRDMQDDFYILDDDEYAIVGTRTDNKYAIGDTVKIRVMDGDLDQKRLDYQLVKS